MMKKQFLAFALAMLFAVPAYAAEDFPVVVDGKAWERTEGDMGWIFGKENRLLLPLRWAARQCGFALEPVQAAARQAGLELRWDGQEGTAYVMEKERILYENEGLGMGVLVPEGCAGLFSVEEAWNGENLALHFMDAEGEMLVFSLARFDLGYWEDELEGAFPIAYSEVFRDGEEIWICVGASDVQYDPEDMGQRASYEALLACKEEICGSFYRFTA